MKGIKSASERSILSEVIKWLKELSKLFVGLDILGFYYPDNGFTKLLKKKKKSQPLALLMAIRLFAGFLKKNRIR